MSLPTNPIRVALVDDHAIVRQGLASMFRDFDQITLLIIATNGQDFLNQLEEQPVDIVLLDIEMPVLSGIQTLNNSALNFLR